MRSSNSRLAAQIRLADGSDGTEIAVDPIETPFSAYVFKLQANMNPRHRDSTAFLRVCSGRFNATWWSSTIGWGQRCASRGRTV